VLRKKYSLRRFQKTALADAAGKSNLGATFSSLDAIGGSPLGSYRRLTMRSSVMAPAARRQMAMKSGLPLTARE
jgi:hypothetical protein